MSEKQYSIQEIKELLYEFFEKRNAYKYLDESAGHKTVQEFLEFLQEKDQIDVDDLDVMRELNG